MHKEITNDVTDALTITQSK